MKQYQGVVVSLSPKTASVKVDTFWQHPLYKKRVKRSKKYLVHNDQKVKVGNKVLFQECRPLSKRKRWKIIKIISQK